MIGRQLTDALRQPERLVPLRLFVPGVPEPQPGLQRPCGCDTDVTVFGHLCCPGAPPLQHNVYGTGGPVGP